MKVTRNVIMDLLPLYQAGEASEDSVAIVEAYLAQHPGFAGQVHNASRMFTDHGKITHPTKEKEMQTLHNTRSLLRWRSFLMGLAIFFTLAPFTVYFSSDSGFQFLLAGKPLSLTVYILFAVLSWVGFTVIHRRSRITSL